MLGLSVLFILASVCSAEEDTAEPTISRSGIFTPTDLDYEMMQVYSDRSGFRTAAHEEVVRLLNGGSDICTMDAGFGADLKDIFGMHSPDSKEIALSVVNVWKRLNAHRCQDFAVAGVDMVTAHLCELLPDTVPGCRGPPTTVELASASVVMIAVHHLMTECSKRSSCTKFIASLSSSSTPPKLLVLGLPPLTVLKVWAEASAAAPSPVELRIHVDGLDGARALACLPHDPAIGAFESATIALTRATLSKAVHRYASLSDEVTGTGAAGFDMDGDEALNVLSAGLAALAIVSGSPLLPPASAKLHSSPIPPSWPEDILRAGASVGVRYLAHSAASDISSDAIPTGALHVQHRHGRSQLGPPYTDGSAVSWHEGRGIDLLDAEGVAAATITHTGLSIIDDAVFLATGEPLRVAVQPPLEKRSSFEAAAKDDHVKIHVQRLDERDRAAKEAGTTAVYQVGDVVLQIGGISVTLATNVGSWVAGAVPYVDVDDSADHYIP